MNIDNTKKLFKDFPELYKQQHLSLAQSPMSFGFECGDGWFDLIYDLSQNISQFDGVEACQVKEKFGGLRFYVDFNDDSADFDTAVYDMINKAEELSYRTCEECGTSASSRNKNGWVRTICEACDE